LIKDHRTQQKILHVLLLGDVVGRLVVNVGGLVVCTVLEQKVDAGKRSSAGRGVQRRPPILINRVDACASRQQHLHHVDVPLDSGVVQCRDAFLLTQFFED